LEISGFHCEVRGTPCKKQRENIAQIVRGIGE